MAVRPQAPVSVQPDPLTFFILLFITAESDHRFLGLARFLRRHKTIVTATGNRGLCLTCNKQWKMFVVVWKAKQTKCLGSIQSGLRGTDFSLSSHGPWRGGVCAPQSFQMILLVFGSPRPSPDFLRSPAPVCGPQSAAFQSHPPGPVGGDHKGPSIKTHPNNIQEKRRRKNRLGMTRLRSTLNWGLAPRRSLTVMERRGW